MEFEIRADRRPDGRGKLVRERQEYFLLMDQGLSSGEACKRVGIHLRTGREWRNGRLASRGHGAMPPAAALPAPGPSRYLTEDERIYIADRLREDAGIREIAAGLGRAPSTV